MKSLNVFLDEKKNPVTKDTRDPPAVLVLKRKYIRNFPGGVKVAVYYSDTLNKHVTIPYSDIQFTEALEEESLLLREDNLTTLEKIIQNNKSANLQFDDGTDMVVDVSTANSIMSVYARATQGNKKKMSDMVNSGIKEFNTLVQFSLQHS